MSAIVAAMVAWQRVADRAAAPGFRAFVGDRVEAAGRAINAASNAAGAGRVVEGAPRTWAVRWVRCVSAVAWFVDGCHVHHLISTPGGRRHSWPSWSGTHWVWSTAAHDPRPCAWPRPFARGADR